MKTRRYVPIIPDYDIDFRDPNYRADPWNVYRELHELGPVSRGSMGELIVVGLRECKKLLTDRGSIHKSPELALSMYPEGPFREHNAHTMTFMDAPEHTRVRRAASHAFTPRSLKQFTPAIEKIADELVAEISERDAFDLITDFAQPFPIYVICEMLGIPATERDMFKRCAHGVILGLEPGASPELIEGANQSVIELTESLERHTRSASPDPEGSVLQKMLVVHNEGELSWKELINQAIFLLNAGHETTSTMLGDLARTLLRERELCSALAQSESLTDNAIEETLRLHPPLHFGWRRVKEPIELVGEEIPVGTMLTIMLAAANRDPSIFANPDIFDAERKNARDHIAFEVGIHTCLGAALARMEARISFARLIPLLQTCELSGEPVENEAVLFQGLASLPVRRTRVAA